MPASSSAGFKKEPEPLDGMCTTMFYDAEPENEGWVQCGKTPGHDRRRSPVRSDRWNSRSWSDNHRHGGD